MIPQDLLGPVATKSRPEMIADRLRSAIADGALHPGEQLVEAELAAGFGVSRGPLREAMARLVAEGLLTTHPHRGIFVAEFGEDDVRDVYDMRLLIENAAAQYVLALDPAAFDVVARQLDEACERMRSAAGRGDERALSQADFDFHAALVAGAGRHRLARSSRTLLVETRMCLGRLEGRYDHPVEAAAEHDGIVAALRGGDPAAVHEVLERHMRDAADLLVGLIRANG